MCVIVGSLRVAIGPLSLSIECCDLRVEELQVIDVPLFPADGVFNRLLDQTDPFQYVCNVVDSSLLHIQFSRSLFQVHALILLRVLDKVYELSC